MGIVVNAVAGTVDEKGFAISSKASIKIKDAIEKKQPSLIKEEVEIKKQIPVEFVIEETENNNNVEQSVEKEKSDDSDELII